MTGGPPAAAGDVVRIAARTDGPDDTRALAAALAPAMHPGDVLLLVGDLGAGKTTFTQGLAAGLGVAEQVTSPTFTLVRPYACAAHGGTTQADAPANGRADGHPPVRTLLHADLYRVERLREVQDLALGELVEEDALAVVEWGDVGAPVLGAGALVLRLQDTDDDDVRLVSLELPPQAAGRAGTFRSVLAPWAGGAEA